MCRGETTCLPPLLPLLARDFVSPSAVGTFPACGIPSPGLVRRALMPSTSPGGRSSTAAAHRAWAPAPTRCAAARDRSPGASWPPAPLESVDGWPLATPETRFLGGAAPWDPPSAGVVHGVRTLHPRAVCRSQPPPARAAWLDPCVRTGAEGLSGGNWMAARVVPGTPGAPRRPGAACAPS